MGNRIITPTGLATATAAAKLTALAHPPRLLAVLCLARGECSVSRLLECTQANPSVLSQQLRILRDRGIVSRTRRGTTSIYRLKDDTAADVVTFAYRSTRSRHCRR